MRDTDRAKVYEAEWTAEKLFDCPGEAVKIHGSTIVIPAERKFGQVEDIQIYVDKVLAHISKPLGIEVRKRKGAKKAHYEHDTNTIAIPDSDWSRREIVVLHEIAHALAPGDHHGAKFRKAYVDLMTSVLGHEAGFILSSSYFQFGLTLAPESDSL